MVVGNGGGASLRDDVRRPAPGHPFLSALVERESDLLGRLERLALAPGELAAAGSGPGVRAGEAGVRANGSVSAWRPGARASSDDDTPQPPHGTASAKASRALSQLCCGYARLAESPNCPAQKVLFTYTLKDKRSVWLPLPFARGGNALGARFQPDSGNRGTGGLDNPARSLRFTIQHPRQFAAGSATAVTGSTRFAGPALALRPCRVTRCRRRRRGWQWPEARFRPLLARQVREPRTGRSWCCVPTGADRCRRACERGEGSGAARRAKRPPGQPRASSLATAFEPSLHFVDVVHALDDDAAGVGR